MLPLFSTLFHPDLIAFRGGFIFNPLNALLVFFPDKDTFAECGDLKRYFIPIFHYQFRDTSGISLDRSLDILNNSFPLLPFFAQLFNCILNKAYFCYFGLTLHRIFSTQSLL